MHNLTLADRRAVDQDIAEAADHIDWTKHPCRAAKTPTVIHTLCRLLKISNVDTVGQTVYLKVALNMYWVDQRLQGWPAQRKQPPMLWGPWPELAEGIAADMQVELLSKGFHDRELGQMNQIVVWEGTVCNAMDLSDFPFDIDFIDLVFVNERACLGNDTIVGAMNAFTLRSINSDAPFVIKVPIPGFCNAGVPPPFMTVYMWDGLMAEWELRGFRSARMTFPVPKGGTKEAWVLAILVERKSEYYFWKAVLPLSLVVFLSCGISIFPVDDLPNRMALTTTMFLACFASLYVINADLPKTHFLTAVDRVVIVTILFIALVAAASWVCYSLDQRGEAGMAEVLNKVVLFGFPICYCSFVLSVFIPAMERKALSMRELTVTDQDPDLADNSASTTPRSLEELQVAEPDALESFENPARTKWQAETVPKLAPEPEPEPEAATSTAQRRAPHIDGGSKPKERKWLCEQADAVTEVPLTSIRDSSVLWTGSMATKFPKTPVSKTEKAMLAIVGIPIDAGSFYGIGGRGGAYLWLVVKCGVMVGLVLAIFLNVTREVRRLAWFCPIMGVVACALPSSGMPIAGGIVFLPVLTHIAGVDARTAVAFTAATQTIGVGVLAPLNWLFHDKRVFIRNGSGDLILMASLPSWAGVATTWAIDIENDVIVIAFTVFVGFCGMYSFWFLRETKNAPKGRLSHSALVYDARTIAMIVSLSFVGGILVGVIGIGIEKLLFIFLTFQGVDARSAGITSIIVVGFTSAFSFVLFLIHDKVPIEWWLMVLPGILTGATIGPWLNRLLGARRVMCAFGILCMVEVLNNVLILTGVMQGAKM